MRKRLLISAIVTILFVSGGPVFAVGENPDGALQQQYRDTLDEVRGAQQANPDANLLCPKITRELDRGMTDTTSDISIAELQRFLSRPPSSYLVLPTSREQGLVVFGPRTEIAIKAFQRDQGIVSPGDGGYGRVGPRTIKKINAICGTDLSAVIPVDASTSIRTTSPNGDEDWPRRTTQVVKWEMSKNSPVRIFLINEQGDRTWLIDTVAGHAGANEYSWFVGGGNIDTIPPEPEAQSPLIGATSNPGGAGEKYSVQVCMIAYALCDKSDTKFSITTPRATLRIWVKDLNNVQLDDPVGGVLIGRNINVLCATNDHDHPCEYRQDDGYLEFKKVPFGSFTVSIGAANYVPDAKTIVINYGNTQKNDDGILERLAGFQLIPSGVPPPVIRVKTPKDGEILRMGTTTDIFWKVKGGVGGNVFRIELIGVAADGVSKDLSRVWTLANVDKHYLQEVLEKLQGDLDAEGCEGPDCPSIPQESLLSNLYTWKIGTCLAPCAPIPPGAYYIRVVRGNGDHDATDKPVYIVPETGTPALSLEYDASQIGRRKVPIEVYYDPDGPGLPGTRIKITERASYGTSDTFLMNIGNPDDDGPSINAGGLGQATGVVAYQGIRVKAKVIIGGTKQNPVVSSIQILP